jgi:hypothetical protein
MVRHSTLALKLSDLDIQDFVYNWLLIFFKDRGHVTKFQGVLSSLRTINASIVQGSGIGPSSYIVNATDLQPIHPENHIVKYADDTYLLIGSSMRGTVSQELAFVKSWAARNNLRLNSQKSREMIISRRRVVKVPELLERLERVTSINILGVTLSSDLRVTTHVDATLASCAGSLHALRTLRAHGLPSEALHVVTRDTTVSRIMYAAPAWWGFTTASDRARIERLLARVRRSGYLREDSPTAAEMADQADTRLLAAVSRNDFHVLRPLFPPIVDRHYKMRPRPHNFVLPTKDDKHFISRVLYKKSSSAH